MTVMIVSEKSQVVPVARAYAERQDDWTQAQEVVFIALMARFAGYGYVVGRIQDYFPLFRRLWDCFHAITPGSLTFRSLGHSPGSPPTSVLRPWGRLTFGICAVGPYIGGATNGKGGESPCLKICPTA